jgi:hypothetical protein
MKLKIINTFILGIFVLLGFSSCVKPDNYNGPNASLQGSVFEDGTDSTVQTCSGNFSIELEQLSWSSTPAPQYIPIKIDGTYQNTELFSGHYRVAIHGGAFWPIDSTEMDIAEGSKHDFKLTPYLDITNFQAQFLDSNTLTLTYNLEAPIDGIPDIDLIQPYVNTTKIVGPGASIYQFSDQMKDVTIPAGGKAWADFTDADKTRKIVIPNLIRGRIFYVRVGVGFNNDDKSSNLSKVIEVTVPQ